MKLDSLALAARLILGQLPISPTSVSKNIFVAEEKALSAVRDKFCIISHSVVGAEGREVGRGSQ